MIDIESLSHPLFPEPGIARREFRWSPGPLWQADEGSVRGAFRALDIAADDAMRDCF